MLHLMRVVGAALDGWAQQLLAKLKLWADPYRKVTMALREAITVCDAWAASTALLTSTYWTGSWKAGRFSDEVLGALALALALTLTLTLTLALALAPALTHALTLTLTSTVTLTLN